MSETVENIIQSVSNRLLKSAFENHIHCHYFAATACKRFIFRNKIVLKMGT